MRQKRLFVGLMYHPQSDLTTFPTDSAYNGGTVFGISAPSLALIGTATGRV